MVNPLRNRLSIHIVRDFFGEVAENVCNTVMQHGEATLDEIFSKSRTVEKHKIRRIIYVLLKQRCLRFSSNQLKGRREIKYSFHSSDVFKFIRRPTLLKILNSGLEISERKLFVYLLLHGCFDSAQRKSLNFASLSTCVDNISINKYLDAMASKAVIIPFSSTTWTQYNVWSTNDDKSYLGEFCRRNFSKQVSLEELDSENKTKMDHTAMLKNTSVDPYIMKTYESGKRIIQSDIESVVHQRFGSLAKRVLRLLFVNRRLDQKEISEMAMLPIKQTREILYKLFKSEYIKIQEVSRTSDHAPSRTLYFWYVDVECIRNKMRQNCFQACLNICIILSKKYSDVEREANLSSEQILYHYCGDRSKMMEGSSFSITYLESISSLLADMNQIVANETF